MSGGVAEEKGEVVGEERGSGVMEVEKGVEAAEVVYCWVSEKNGIGEAGGEVVGWRRWLRVLIKGDGWWRG